MNDGNTFGGVGCLILAEPGEVFVLKPGHVAVVVLVVLLAVPGFLAARHDCKVCGLRGALEAWGLKFDEEEGADEMFCSSRQELYRLWASGKT